MLAGGVAEAQESAPEKQTGNEPVAVDIDEMAAAKQPGLPSEEKDAEDSKVNVHDLQIINIPLALGDVDLA